MDEALTTLVGWVAAKPLYTVTRNGVPFLSLRAGVTPRRFNRSTGLWEDGEPTFFAVSCWRALAENANASELTPGTPIVAHGRLRVREYEQGGERRFTVELEAVALGPDLTRGRAIFQRVAKGGALTVEDRAEAATLSDQAAGLASTLGSRPASADLGQGGSFPTAQENGLGGTRENGLGGTRENDLGGTRENDLGGTRENNLEGIRGNGLEDDQEDDLEEAA